MARTTCRSVGIASGYVQAGAARLAAAGLATIVGAAVYGYGTGGRGPGALAAFDGARISFFATLGTAVLAAAVGAATSWALTDADRMREFPTVRQMGRYVGDRLGGHLGGHLG